MVFDNFSAIELFTLFHDRDGNVLLPVSKYEDLFVDQLCS